MSPSPQTNVSSITGKSATEVVESFLGAVRDKDLERGLALMSEDVVYQNVPLKPLRGRAAAERTLRAMARIPGEVGIEIHNIAERAGVVLTERTDSLRGPFMDLEFWVCGTFEVRDGKITLWRDYFDVGAFVFKLLTSPLRRLVRARTAPAGE